MALVFCDSFDIGTTKWSGRTGGSHTTPASGIPGHGFQYLHTGGGANSYHGLWYNFPTGMEHATVIFGANGVWSTKGRWVVGFGSWQENLAHCWVMPNTSTGVIEVRRGTQNGTIITQTPGVAATQGPFQHIGIKITKSATVGQVTLWINGAEVLNTASDLNTTNGGSLPEYSRIYLYSHIFPTGGATPWDDVYILNGAGTDFNDYLGEVQVTGLLPNGNGQTNLMGSDGNQTDNYLLVDEQTPNGDTDYVWGDTEGQLDTYAMASIPAGNWNVLAVQTSYDARKAEPGSRHARSVLRVGGTNYFGPSRAVVGEVYPANAQVAIWPENPAGGLWSSTSVNDMEVGVEVRDS